MAEANVNPFHPTAAKTTAQHERELVFSPGDQDIVSHKSLRYQRYLLWHRIYTTSSTQTAVKSRGQEDAAHAAGVSEIYSCCGCDAKETLWQFAHLYVPTTRCKARIAILGIPLQWSCLMRGVVFLASPRLSPPPTASRLLNWVRPCKCGGYRAETPSLPCAAWLSAENATSTHRLELLRCSQTLSSCQFKQM